MNRSLWIFCAALWALGAAATAGSLWLLWDAYRRAMGWSG
jgi:hypothetical protein